jgi:hypothetical protein
MQLDKKNEKKKDIRLALSLGLLFFFLSVYPLADKSQNLITFLDNNQNMPAEAFYLVVIVVCKLLILHAAFIGLHYVILRTLGPQRLLYALSFSAYTMSYLFVYYPQLFEIFFNNKEILFSLNFLQKSLLVFVFGAIFCISLLFSLPKLRAGRKWLGVAIISLLAAHIAYINNPYSFERKITVANTSDMKPMILFLGIDGLRPDILKKFATAKDYPYISKLLNESHFFENAYTPIARTHPAYHSIFHAKNPEELKIRINNSRASVDTDASLENSKLSALKKDGYKINLSLSDTSFSYYFEGNIVDQTEGPPPGLHNLILPYFVSDPLLFSWLNNSIGRFFFPEIIGNSAYSAFWPQQYKVDVKRSIKSILEKDAKAFALYHLVKLHWPGSNQYPYYKPLLRQNNTNSIYDYTSTHKILTRIGTKTPSDRLRNIQIYELGVKQVLDTYLEPLVKWIYEQKITSNATIVLLSDHGEAFYTDDLVPINKLPTHGGSLDFHDDSNHSVLAIRFPEAQGKIIKNAFSLHKIFPYIEQRTISAQKHAVQMETDRWIEPTFTGDESYSLYKAGSGRFLFEKGLPLYDPETERQILVEKRRGVINAGKFTAITPSIYGYYVKSGSDLDFDSFFLHDQNEKLLPPFISLGKKNIRALLSSNSKLISENFQIDPAKNERIYFQSGVELLNYFIDPVKAEKIFNEIFLNPKTGKSVKLDSLIQIYKICAYFPFLHKERADHGNHDIRLLIEKLQCDLRREVEIGNRIQELSSKHYSELNAGNLRPLFMAPYFKPQNSVLITFLKNLYGPNFHSAHVNDSWENGSEFQKLSFFSKKILGSKGDALENNLTKFFQVYRNSAAYGMYGLLDSWYLWWISQIRDRPISDTIRILKKISEEDPYLSLDAMIVVGELLLKKSSKNTKQFWQEILEAPDKRAFFRQHLRATLGDLWK